MKFRPGRPRKRRVATVCM